MSKNDKQAMEKSQEPDPSPQKTLNGHKRDKVEDHNEVENGAAVDRPVKKLDTGYQKQAPTKPTDKATQGASPDASGKPASDGVIEEGHVYFFYRPKVGVKQVHSMNDVQRFYMVLHPTPSKSKARLVVIGKKRLPATKAHERFFGFVETTAESVQALTAGMGETQYATKTRGVRTQPAAHSLGQGVYSIITHARGTRFVYKLEVPLEPGPVQRVFEISKEGSFHLSIKNPNNKQPGVPSAGPDPDYTQEQQQEFESYSWISAEDPTLLDVAGTELLLVAARDDPVERYGDEGKRLEELYEEDLKARASDSDADISKDPEAAKAVLVEKLKEDIEPSGGHEVQIPVTEVETGEFAK